MNPQSYPPMPVANHHQPPPLGSELSGPPSHYAGYGAPTGAMPPGQQPPLPPISPTHGYYQGMPPQLPPPHMQPPRTGGQGQPGDREPRIKNEIKSEHEEKPQIGALSIEKDDETRSYRLVVVQQPQRARMCGFGDKDRRPLTPPPMLRLSVMDKNTKKEVPFSEIDHQYYVIHCDLWDANGLKEVNLIQNQNNCSISSGSATSFREAVEGVASGYFARPPPDGSMMPSSRYPPHMSMDPYPPPGYGAYAQAGYPPPPPPQQQPMAVSQYGYPMPQYRPGDMPPGGMPPVPSQRPYGSSPYPSPVQAAPHRVSTGGQSATGMFTRNLIGSLASSAQKLQDEAQIWGIWFIPHDMSIRTEGVYRLRFSFLNVRDENKQQIPTGVSDAGALNKGKARILATTFSEPFTVFSAKKFPGVENSTPLMKCFAKQGVKIPIRKEGQDDKKRKAGDLYDEDDEGEDDNDDDHESGRKR